LKDNGKHKWDVFHVPDTGLESLVTLFHGQGHVCWRYYTQFTGKEINV
jgi:hypothetical protein